jgi:hypothetical protein
MEAEPKTIFEGSACVRESIANFYWSKGMTPFTERVESALKLEGVSICFTDLCNCKLVREPIANFYWSKGMTPLELKRWGHPYSRRRLNLLHGSL